MLQNDNKVMGIIFANMHDVALSSLTQHRTMASVPFGGRYRLIDFPLSNLVNAGITDVGLITKANYQSLMDHVGAGRAWDLARKTGGLHILPPYGDKNFGIYRGKMEALGSALGYLHGSSAKYILLSDCEIVANIDLGPFIERHAQTGADITMMYANSYLDNEEAKDSTIVNFDENGRLVEVMCSPDITGEFNYSMNILIVGREFLIKLINEAISKGEYSLDRDILQKKMKELKINGFFYDGFVRRIGSMKGYYQANIDLLSESVREQLFTKERPVYTKIRDEAPVRYGLQSSAKNCFIADGCIIEGEVENSIIFRGVKIAKGASVKNCILMQGTEVGEKADLQYAMTDKNVVVSNYRTVIGTSTYPAYIAKGTTI
ncbi:glucose-1-phosphate adenylyltransferase, GlgD subunit [[Clostridium] methylpentosum DSM 5476]|jgi:glucose-1-phosphate adenylyltransferase|uniref:Glucose-1-phosphate adenylyltransferase, GlgD subunit n=1 Tax=[Clostridium] methylpentosum DSM 5476 TaxID=537013 RepID=C0EBJ2_9FIRM|nr:glucose-1-phosphate adenylyltransferase, GlgD subunit [[Clostridium] methylpentosum DSM 5476]MDY3988176.1 glucose-1-phosphate adenylyltransferase subunit GlgD [Massilioclostridium sp.]MEE1490466.1 glucose-1-phosphate adenylyltransferase subunit GlgD [Massilioclostridium sp.]